LAAVFLGPAAILAAQQPVAPTPTPPPARGSHLTLGAALDMAARQNLDLVAARMQRAVTAAGILISGQRPNPTLGFSASRDLPHESLTLDQPIELGGKRRLRIGVATQERALTDVEITDLERQVRRQVREAYFNAAQARSVTAQRDKALQLTKQLQSTAQARLDAGEIPELEVFQAQLEVLRADADRKVAQQEEKVALSRLNALLNEPAGTDWDLLGEFENLPSAEQLGDLVTKAGASNPALLHLTQEAKIEQSRERLLRAERIPDITVGLGLDMNSPPDYNAALRGQVSVDLPLFSRNQGELAQSRATQSLLDSQAGATRRSIAGEVEAAYYEVDARRSEVQLYRDGLLPASQRLVGLAQDSYSAGKSPIMTVLDAQRNALQLELDYLTSVLELQSAFAQLEETVGVPLD
jgi:outer membrane protein, heavy metal efflux system